MISKNKCILLNNHISNIRRDFIEVLKINKEEYSLSLNNGLLNYEKSKFNKIKFPTAVSYGDILSDEEFK